jgi:hypothetical protein
MHARLQDNQLEGSVPVSTLWRSLHILRLANNRFSVSSKSESQNLCFRAPGGGGYGAAAALQMDVL